MHVIADWFEKHKKSYPWRKNKNPYSVWISEVMLQQTRAEVVIAYFEKWMKKFPTVEALAESEIEEVIKCWEGLGYYSRARNLHAGAKQIVSEFGGQLPSEKEKLLSIKGIGPYTAGAILAFGFGLRVPFVDGNISRVFSRVFAYGKCVIKGSGEITQMVDTVLPEKRAPLVMEGLIELGQKVCKKVPLCQECPLKGMCQAYKTNQQSAYPVRSVKHKTIRLERQVAVILCDGYVLLQENKHKGVMADLWELPYIECDKDREVSHLTTHFPLHLQLETIFPKVVHYFTKYKATLYPYLFTAREREVVDHYRWVSLDDIDHLPFSSGHKRIIEQMLECISC